MTESTEVEDQVDLYDDNFMEEINDDDDVEEQIEDEVEELADDENDEEQQSLKEEYNVRELSPEIGRGDIDAEPVKNEEVSDEGDKVKRSELLALPPHGSEIFLGGLPRDVLEEDLRDLCDPMGDIVEIRIIKNNDTGGSKGFAFVAFKTKDFAQKAIEELHSKEFKGRTLRCSLSESKYRLFIGNVPKNWTDEEFRKVIEEVGPGAENIELIKDLQNPGCNRGFAFVEYYNNACADYSRQQMCNEKFKLDGNTPTVTWADPKSKPDHSATSQVRALYVKNIPENTPSEQLKELFQRHGEVTKVVMPPAKSGGKRDFGFVHFSERSSALKAVKDGEKYEINGQVLEVVLAKPQNEKKIDVGNPQSSGSLPNFIPNPGYGAFSGNPYAALGTGYGVAAGLQQPVIYGRGPMPAGMQMVPMVLPDGRIGYVFQQPGVQMPPVQPRRNEKNNGTGGPQARGGPYGGDDTNRNRRYRPY